MTAPTPPPAVYLSRRPGLATLLGVAAVIVELFLARVLITAEFAHIVITNGVLASGFRDGRGPVGRDRSLRPGDRRGGGLRLESGARLAPHAARVPPRRSDPDLRGGAGHLTQPRARVRVHFILATALEAVDLARPLDDQLSASGGCPAARSSHHDMFRANHSRRLGARRRADRPVEQPGSTGSHQLWLFVTMRQLLESGVHFGHQTRRWNRR